MVSRQTIHGTSINPSPKKVALRELNTKMPAKHWHFFIIKIVKGVDFDTAFLQ